MRVAIITAIFGGYEKLQPTYPQTLDTDWICVSDRPITDLPGEWRIVTESPSDSDMNMAAKRPKLMPWLYTDAEYSIWIDASFRVIAGRFASEVGLMANPIAQFSHPWRQCALEEAEFSARMNKYDGDPLLEQAAHYRTAGHPAQWGLWVAGMIARKHTPEVKKLGELWLGECQRWGRQDQVSQPFALRAAGLRPQIVPGDHFNNPWISYQHNPNHDWSMKS